jgi:hypothetical protein
MIRPILMFAAAVLLPACPLLDVQTDVPEVCVTYNDLAVDVPAGTASITRTFTVDDLSALHDVAAHDASLQFLDARVVAESGLDDLSFVHTAAIAIAGPDGSGLPRATIYACDGDCPASGKGLDLAPSGPVDALAYANADSLVIDLQLDGDVPAMHATFRAEVCMTGKAGYTYEP